MASSHREGDGVETRIKRRIAISAAGATILAGGGGTYALADRGGDEERQAFIGDAAGRLHVSTGELRSALRGAFFDRLDADVKKGRLPQKEADQIKQQVRRRGDAGPPGPGPPGPRGPGGPHPGGPFMEGAQAAAKYLGLSDAQLRSQLRSGKTLAQVAKDKGKSVDGLKAAIKDAIVSKLDDRIDQMVNHSGPPGPPPGARHFGAGPPPGGPPPPGF